MRKGILALAIVLVAFPVGVSAQEASTPRRWISEQRTDPLRGDSYMQFSLDGIFLSRPDRADVLIPHLVLRCAPGQHRASSGTGNGHTNGKFIQGYIDVGGVVDANVGVNGDVRVHVQFRLDDGKLQDDYWSHSTDYSAVFFESVWLNNAFYGHMLLHKESSGPQVRKVVIGLPEYLGNEVVAEFDLPDSTDVADACGAVWHK
jgi:hypothetical protein